MCPQAAQRRRKCPQAQRVQRALTGRVGGFKSVDAMAMGYAGWVSSKLAMRASVSRKDATRERPSRFA